MRLKRILTAYLAFLMFICAGCGCGGEDNKKTNNPPSVILKNIPLSDRGDIPITFDLSDPEGADCIVILEYKGGSVSDTWTAASVYGTDTFSSGTDLTIIWDSGADELGGDFSDYQIRLCADDGVLQGDQVESNAFSIDNTLSVTVNTPSGSQWSDIDFTFDLSVPDRIVCSLGVEFQGGSVSAWSAADASGVTGLSSGAGQTFIWHSKTDVPSEAASDFKVQIRAESGAVYSEWIETSLFVIDNTNQPPVVTSLSTPGTPQAGNVSFSYGLNDVDLDPCSIHAEYRYAGGTWSSASISGDVTGIGNGSGNALMWNSDSDTQVSAVDFEFRIRAHDGGQYGDWVSSGQFELDNNDPPAVTLDAVSGEQRGDTVITFTLTDDGDMPCTIEAEYQGGFAGSTWTSMSISELLTGVIPGNRSLTWETWIDEYGGVDDSYSVRLRAFDGETWSIWDQITVYVNNAVWTVMPIRSQEEYNLSMIGGEAEQHMHSIARCSGNSDIIYASHDVGHLWRSENGGDTWIKCLCRGLSHKHGQSVMCDPVDSDTVFIIVDDSYDFVPDVSCQGLYRSSNRGKDFEQVLSVSIATDRVFRHNIEYDPASVSGGKAQVWYAAVFDDALYRSDSAGDSGTWNSVADLSGHSIVYGVYAHPSDGNTVYLVSSLGLYRSTAKGAGLTAYGDLPAGDVSTLAINPSDPSVMYAAVVGVGLYKSVNSGVNFSLVISTDTQAVFMNPGYPDVLYLVNQTNRSIYSSNGGVTWNDSYTSPAPGLGRNASWKNKLAGKLTGIVPDPTDPDEAVAFSRATIWKTTDGGADFADSSTLFTGYAPSWYKNTIAFDPNNSTRFATFNCDVGTCITSNSGDWFDRRNDYAWTWTQAALIEWYGTYSGAFKPVAGSDDMVVSIGGYFDTELFYTDDACVTQALVTDYPNAEEVRNLFVAFHPVDTDFVYAGGKYSTDGGQTFTEINWGTFDGGTTDLDPEILGMCNAQPDTVYAMNLDRTQLLRSDDRGANWSLYVEPGWDFKQLDSLATFTAHPTDPDLVYTLDSSNDLASFNGTTWTNLNVKDLPGTGPENNYVRCVSVDPTHPEIVYAGMSGNGISCVYRSQDGGATWKDISYNLPRSGASVLKVNPHSGELFFGSSFGTWVFPPSAGFMYSSTPDTYLLKLPVYKDNYPTPE